MTIDIHARRHYGATVTLSVAETLAALEAPNVFIEDDGDGCRALWIEYEGRWCEVVREDLRGEVCSARANPPPTMSIPEALAIERRRVLFGARISDDAGRRLFSIVDSRSDG